MGWVEFIIIPKMKVIIDAGRGLVDIGLSESEKQGLKHITDEESIEFIELDQIKIKDLNLKDIKNFIKATDLMNQLSGININKFLLFWLEQRNIDYKIISELSKEWEEFDKTGYVIINKYYD